MTISGNTIKAAAASTVMVAVLVLALYVMHWMEWALDRHPRLRLTFHILLMYVLVFFASLLLFHSAEGGAP